MSDPRTSQNQTTQAERDELERLRREENRRKWEKLIDDRVSEKLGKDLANVDKQIRHIAVEQLRRYFAWVIAFLGLSSGAAVWGFFESARNAVKETQVGKIQNLAKGHLSEVQGHLKAVQKHVRTIRGNLNESGEVLSVLRKNKQGLMNEIENSIKADKNFIGKISPTSSGEYGQRIELKRNNGNRMSSIGSEEEGGVLKISRTNGEIVAKLGASFDKTGRGVLALYPEPNSNTSQQNPLVIMRVGGNNLDDLPDRKVFVGVVENKARLELSGESIASYAKFFDTNEDLRPGSVVSIGDRPQKIRLSSRLRDPKVLGVISGARGLSEGIVISGRNKKNGSVPVALSGVVYVRVNTERGRIDAGDLIVASSTPGVATKLADDELPQGVVIGKALEEYGNFRSEGLIQMLVMSQ